MQQKIGFKITLNTPWSHLQSLVGATGTFSKDVFSQGAVN